MSALQMLHWVAGLVVLAEALNKLERTAPFAPGLRLRARLVAALKATAWALLALGAGGSVATPMLLALGVPAHQYPLLLHLEQPTLAEVSVLCGFAVLVVRTRVKEG
jgi:hypothetical protein